MFKKGGIYTRVDVGEICYPGVGRPAGGDWDTGYVRPRALMVREGMVDDGIEEWDQIIFANIGVAGRTGHDFPNEYDPENQTIIWYGKPRSHSGQPTFRRLIAGEATHHFFAREDSGQPKFMYLGIAKYVAHEDGAPITVNDKAGTAIRLVLRCQDAGQILTDLPAAPDGEDIAAPPGVTTEDGAGYSFEMEKYLEEFIVDNWSRTVFAQEGYAIYEKDGQVVGRQYQTGIGPCDILAFNRATDTFLVIELKRGTASDKVIGQVTRYMGKIKERFASKTQSVKGRIVALEDDERLRASLTVIDDLDFYRYQVDFKLLPG